MSYAAEIVADSIGPHGIRLTTLRLVYPRFIHAEFLRHRGVSHSVSSSRAIPPERLIQKVIDNPFVPDTFNRRVKGMGVGAAIAEYDQAKAKQAWLNDRDKAVQAAIVLNGLECDKSRINRLLEPFLWVTDLVTATEWSNFFALRQPDNDEQVPQLSHGAQPEFQIIARMIRDVMAESSPDQIGWGDWHLPYLTEGEEWQRRTYRNAAGEVTPEEVDRKWAMVSAGRCFVTSYDKLDDITMEDPDESHARAQRGVNMAHWSPMEHQSQVMDKSEWSARRSMKAVTMAYEGPMTPARMDLIDRLEFCGNLRGYIQLRKYFPFERDYQRVIEAESTGVPERA